VSGDARRAGRLAGRVAIVTGGGGAIGTEHCLLLAKEGAKVVVNDIGASAVADGQPSNADRVVAKIREAGGEAVADTNSAADFAGAAAVVEHAVDVFGRVDILVNNATMGLNNDLWRFTEEEYELALSVNLTGYLAMTKHVIPHMARQGKGAIVNTSSGSGFGHPSYVAYAAAKEGVVGLTRTTAMEVGRFGIRANAIRPAAATYQATSIYHERTHRWRTLMARTMRPRGIRTRDDAKDPNVRSPAKISPFVVWLCTDAASHVNGRVFHVLGDHVGLYPEPDCERIISRPGGWDLDALDLSGWSLTAHLTNDYLFPDDPELSTFEP
jgi:NAD(P)-dependent dehydrogenase (short-subunit alcohol dehydrogenase family)